MPKTPSQLRAMWEREQESYRTQEIGSGSQRFVREVLECQEIFNLVEGRLSTPIEHRKTEFIVERKTKDRRHADFVVYIDQGIIIPVEVEQHGRLERGESQLATYQTDLEKKYGVLTDGHTWRFYNNSLYRAFTIDQLLSETDLFLEYWKEYIKLEHYYLSFFGQKEQLPLLEQAALDVEDARQLFFEDITTLIKSLRSKLQIEGYFGDIDNWEAKKKATEITYAYIIQFILYKTLVDNRFESFTHDYELRIDSIYRAIKNGSYKEILATIDGMSESISKSIYRPFAIEQAQIQRKLSTLLHKAKNELSDVSPWLDVIVFIRKYNFRNVQNEIFGYVYEKLYQGERKGQYFTDPAVVDFMLEQVGYTEAAIREKVRSGELGTLSLVDPACGSGTFLYSATREIMRSFTNVTKDTSREVEEMVTKNIFGLDVGEFPLYLAEMSILMRLLPLIIGEQFNNPLDKKIKVFVTKDSVAEFMGSGVETSGADPKMHAGQLSYFGTIIQPEFPSYVRDEADLSEMKHSMASFPRRRFDYVIANPPYVSYNECSKQGLLTFQLLKGGKVKLNNIYGVNLHSVPGNPKRYRPNPNLYAFFLALGLALLKDDGKLCYIIPQTFLINADFDVLRFHLAKFVTIERLIIFSGKMFVGRGLRQDKPIPTSSLILVASRRTPTSDHEVSVLNYQNTEGTISEIVDNISQGVNTAIKKVSQADLLRNIANWNFIKFDEEQAALFEAYKLNSESLSIYYEHALAKQRFKNTFVFDGGYSIDESRFRPAISEGQFGYEYPKLNNERWTIEENRGFWPDQRSKNDPMYIALRQGNQGYSFLDAQHKIIWSYNATDRFFYTAKPVIWARNKMLGIASDDKSEIMYLFALLNSRVTKFVLDKSVKIAQEDTRTILVSLQIVKSQIRVPKINEENQPIKTAIIQQVERLLDRDRMCLSDLVDFSGVLLQRFDNVRIDGNVLVLTYDLHALRLKVKQNARLVADALSDLRRAIERAENTHGIGLAELRALKVVDFSGQTALKQHIDDLVFAMYFKVPLAPVHKRQRS